MYSDLLSNIKQLTIKSRYSLLFYFYCDFENNSGEQY